ncbi:MAG: hypothetical protein R6U19_09880 [Bacteroidales bacterium]
MKRVIVMNLLIVLFSIGAANAQKAEVLYFKADLGCCQARTCDFIEKQVKQVVKENYKNDDVVFRQVKLADKANAELVKKHKAKSQTVVIVNTQGSEKVTDVTSIVKQYSRSKDKDELEDKLITAIKETL